MQTGWLQGLRKSLKEKKVVREVRYVPNRQFLYIPFADLGIVVVGGGVGGAIPEPS